MFGKVLLSLVSIFSAILAVLFVFIYFAAPELPPETDRIIDQVLANGFPEKVTGESGVVSSNGVDIWYESRSPEGEVKGTIILIMGFANDALSWPEYFLSPLLEAGYRIVRNDNRGSGLSDWVENWRDKPYSLEDMAEDSIAIMDHLGIEKAHLIGVSMGGMIAQELVIKYPERFLTLTSLMSSGFIADPELPPPSRRFLAILAMGLLKYGFISTEKNQIRLAILVRQLIRRGTLAPDELQRSAETALYNIRRRRGYNGSVFLQHEAAVMNSRSRYEGLSKLKLPTLLIHGKRDVFVPFAHGKRMAELMPFAETHWFEGMAHDIEPFRAKKIIPLILENLSRSSAK